MSNVNWICLAVVAFLAIQARSNPTYAEKVIPVQEDQNTKVNQVIKEELENIHDVFRNTFSMDTGRHGSSHKTNIAPKLASIVEYMYASCRRKLAASGLALTKLGGGYYYFHMDLPLMKWAQARDWCLSQGMVLVNIENGAEDKIIINRLNKLFGAETGDTTFVWIGGNDDATNLVYKWGNGMSFDYTNWEVVPVQPTGENCVSILKRNGHTQWDDRVCNDPGRFVCELPNPCSDILNMVKSLKSSSSGHSSGSESSSGHSSGSESSSGHSSDSSHDFIIHRGKDSHGKKRGNKRGNSSSRSDKNSS